MQSITVDVLSESNRRRRYIRVPVKIMVLAQDIAATQLIHHQEGLSKIRGLQIVHFEEERRVEDELLRYWLPLVVCCQLGGGGCTSQEIHSFKDRESLVAKILWSNYAVWSLEEYFGSSPEIHVLNFPSG